MPAVYEVSFPDGDCLCGSRLTNVARKRMQARADRLVPSVSEKQKPEAIPRLDLEFLRVVRGELATLSVEEREALREDYAQQVAEAQKHLESLLRVLTMIESYTDAEGARG